jgi:virginiamycin B lyase
MKIPICFVTLVFVASAQTIKEFPLASQAGNVCVSSINSSLVWLSMPMANQISSMDASGNVTSYTIPTPNSSPAGCAFGPDGLLYFGEQSGLKIASLDTSSGVFREFPIAPPNNGIAGVAFDANGILNIMVSKSSAIQRMRTDGSFLPPIMLGGGQWPHIPTLCGGNIWFVEYTANRVARLTPTGGVREALLPQLNSKPFAITCASGLPYFTEYNANKIGEVDPTAFAITQWGIPSVNSQPMGIATGADGNIYFAESASDKIGKLASNGSITEYLVPTPKALPNKVTACFRTAICFSERGTNQLGVLR